MKSVADTFKLLSDSRRLRMLLLLKKKELCVCQLMGIMGGSQPLISRNLSLLRRSGFLDERREGKLRFYRLSRNLPQEKKEIIKAIIKILKGDETLCKDMMTLQECTEFQKKTGRCDMKTFMDFLKRKNARRGKR